MGRLLGSGSHKDVWERLNGQIQLVGRFGDGSRRGARTGVVRGAGLCCDWHYGVVGYEKG